MPRDSLAVAGKKDSIAEAKITADMAAGEITRSQTGHERLEEMDFIFGNVFLSSPDIIRQSENENRPVLYRQQCRCQVLEVNAFMPDHAYGETLYYRVEIQRISPAIACASLFFRI